MIFIKEHLLGNDYEWSLTGQPYNVKEQVPTRKRFDRFNGNCVLHMLNLFNFHITNLTVNDGQHKETLIANELPLVFSSEVSVFNWLKDKFVCTSSVSRLN